MRYNTNALKAYKNVIVNSSQTLFNVGILSVCLWLTLAIVDGAVNFGLLNAAEIDFHLDYILQSTLIIFVFFWLLSPYIVTRLTGAKKLTYAEIAGNPKLETAINNLQGKVGNTRTPSIVTAVLITCLFGILIVVMDYLTGNNVIASTIAYNLPLIPYAGKTLFVPFDLWKTFVAVYSPIYYLIIPVGLVIMAIGNRRPIWYIVDQPYANAFCFGYGLPLISRPRIAVTRGLLNILEMEQIEAVLHHEYGHYKNLDLLVTMLSSLVPMITYSIGRLLLSIALNYEEYQRQRRDDDDEKSEAWGRFILMVIGLIIVVISWIAELGTYAISRSREKLADNFSALLSGRPLALAEALERISNSRDVRAKVRAFNWEGRSLLPLLYIHVPWETHSAVPAEWLATHPPIKRRIAYLRGLALTKSPLAQDNSSNE
ncbi:MAG: M48 family metallopeptidase [Candidatus Hermodarchaeota archaeon]